MTTEEYIEGYWRLSEDDHESPYPWPVANQVDNTDFIKILEYVEKHYAHVERYFGRTVSRLTGESLGSAEFLLDTGFICLKWPGDYRTHYLKAGVKPTEKFEIAIRAIAACKNVEGE